MAAAPGLRLPRSFYDRPVLTVAPDLLGRVVRHATPDGVVAVRLTEVEAYGGVGEDPGSHAHRGPTRRNAVMFDRPGSLYVYFTYGMHWCANLVCGPRGQAAAVLLRAGEVVEGEALARTRRTAARGVVDLARGPARLASALGLDGDDDGTDVCARASRFTVHEGRGPRPAAVASGPRVGVSGDGAPTPWRFWLDGDPTVSRYRPGRTAVGSPGARG
jgi:DNA-3-methyladenine glycosylase